MDGAGSSPYDRFKEVIRTWYKSSHRDKDLALNQIANLTWGKGDSNHTGYISRLVQHPMYREFFEADWVSAGKVGRARVKWTAVEESYPSLIGQTLSGNVFTIMDRALHDEAVAVRKRPQGPGVWLSKALHINKDVPSAEEAAVEYDYETDDPEDDAPFPFMEGLPVTVRHRDGRPFKATLLAVDEKQGKLIVRYTSRGFPHAGVMRERREALVTIKRNALEQLRDQPGVFRRLLEQQPLQPKQVSSLKLKPSALLDDSQRAAIEAASQQDVTVIWGPPGTGKTHTVGELVAHLAHEGKRVLVAAIANVAVDQAAIATIRAAERHGWDNKFLAGMFLRHGYARDPDVIQEDRLFPQRLESKRLRRDIERHRLVLQNPKSDLRAKAEARMGIEDAQKALVEVTQVAIAEARVVFTTVYQTAISSVFPKVPGFDVVVLDEASMMSTVDALLAARHARKQVIIAGDVKQLGPIAVASTEAAQKCLHRDILTHLRVDRNPEPPLVQMLLQQRRMHPDVSSLVNQRFYKGRLEDAAAAEKLRAAAMDPSPNHGATLISTERVQDAKVEHTSTQSRRNTGSARISASLAAWFAKTVRVGLITPYASQVALLRRFLASISDPIVQERIHVGTIHTFQGSERDVIIWDLVETCDLELGRLFRDDNGKRLVNVAISRAQGKLVVVGAPSAFSPQRSGSARCAPLSQMLFAYSELGQHQQAWDRVRERLGVEELTIGERSKPLALQPPPEPRNTRRLIRR